MLVLRLTILLTVLVRSAHGSVRARHVGTVVFGAPQGPVNLIRGWLRGVRTGRCSMGSVLSLGKHA